MTKTLRVLRFGSPTLLALVLVCVVTAGRLREPEAAVSGRCRAGRARRGCGRGSVPRRRQHHPGDVSAVPRRRRAHQHRGMAQHHVREVAVRLRREQLGHRPWRRPGLRGLPQWPWHRRLGQAAQLGGRPLRARPPHPRRDDVHRLSRFRRGRTCSPGRRPRARRPRSASITRAIPPWTASVATGPRWPPRPTSTTSIRPRRLCPAAIGRAGSPTLARRRWASPASGSSSWPPRSASPMRTTS